MPAQISSHSHLEMPDIQNNNNVKYNLSFGFNFGDGINVKGRLKASIKFWESIDASEFVLNTIKYGYKIPFVTVPQNFVFENNRSAKLEHEFVTENIFKLLNNGLVREVQTPPNIVSPLSVAKSSSGKLRLILDLRYVNAHIYKEKVCFEDWQSFENFIDVSGFMFKFDLKQGYHHIDIFEDHQTYLGCAWEIDGKLRYFVFTVLPFGLSPAPRVFTKVLRPLVALWRSKGIKIVLFLDDGCCCENNFEKTLAHSNFVKNVLKRSGFVANEDKSVWEPTKSLTWLGICVDLQRNIYFIHNDRIERILSFVEKILSSAYVSPRQLSSFTGMILSCKFVLRNIVRLKTRCFYALIESCCSWDTKLNRFHFDGVNRDLLFWKNNIKVLNCRYIKNFKPRQLLCYSDASSVALGAVLDKHQIVHKNLNSEEQKESSTWRELYAIFYALNGLYSKLKGENILWHTDNLAASKIVEIGSGKVKLQKLALAIFELCQKGKISLTVCWIPREYNAEADAVSKYTNSDDWEISKDLFEYLNGLWGPFTIDRFADENNKKTERFNSKFNCPGSDGVNSFVQDWKNENNWLVPPISELSNVIKHIMYQNITGVLIAPKWHSARYWPLLVDCTGNYKKFIKDFEVFPNGCVNHIIKKTGSKNMKIYGDLIAFKI